MPLIIFTFIYRSLKLIFLFRPRLDPRFDRDGLYAREREAREREVREREARERYMSSHRDDRMDRERAFERLVFLFLILFFLVAPNILK